MKEVRGRIRSIRFFPARYNRIEFPHAPGGFGSIPPLDQEMLIDRFSLPIENDNCEYSPIIIRI